jgi:hypothetical protein
VLAGGYVGAKAPTPEIRADIRFLQGPFVASGQAEAQSEMSGVTGGYTSEPFQAPTS